MGMPCRLVHRSAVPRSLESVTSVSPHEVDPHELGLDPGAVRAVWQAAEGFYRSGLHPALQLCVRVRGEIVIDRAIGYASGNGPPGSDDGPLRPVTLDTPFSTLSGSKGVTAMVIHGLVERGVIHLDDAVCEYVPEFAPHGKDRITIRHLLAHRAGIPTVPPEQITLDPLARPGGVREVMYGLVPSSRPGRRLAYHALSAGFVLGEVVERVTGRDIRAALDEIVCRPLGLRSMNYGVPDGDPTVVARNYYTGLPVSAAISRIFRNILGFDFTEVAEISNDPRFLRGIIPAANLVTTANEFSLFYQVLLDEGTFGGVRVFDPRTVRRAVSEQSYLEFDRTLGLPIRYGLGFMLGGRWVSLFGPGTERAFGHLGFTNIIAWADPDRQVAAALLTSGKPLVHPGVYYFLEIPRRIGAAAERRR
jgi:CubicO group peptidase (beta-lactamase class C family)